MFSVQKGDLTAVKADLLVLNAFEGFEKFGGATADVDAVLGGELMSVAKEDRFKGGVNETLLVRPSSKFGAKRILLVGLGKKEDFTIENVREAAALSAQCAEKLGAKSVVSILHGAGAGKLAPKECARAITEGAQLAVYKFDKYKKKKNKPSVQTFTIMTNDGRAVKQAEAGITLGNLGVAGTMYARDLVNTPSGHMQPAELVAKALEIGKASKGVIKVKVMDKAALEKMGAGGLLGIAQGADHPPAMVQMTYIRKTEKQKNRKTETRKRIAIVGKAITFDSGGLSIKPAEGMYTMKLDMAGAAAVLGLFSVIKELKPNVIVEGIFGACENMPSGKAIRPGDVVTAMNGTTIEVLHTDAEGRVTLADTLSYAVRQKPDMIVDLATLTGACVVALGEEITGVMSNDAKLENRILAASGAVGEKMWSLPLEKNYKRELKSEVADLKNLAGRYGGALTAGLFLQEFVDNIPWAHLDIAGPSFAERPINAYTGKGGTGVGVRTLMELVRGL